MDEPNAIAEPTVPPKPRRKKPLRRRPHHPRKIDVQQKAQAALPDDLRGLTLNDCPVACGIDNCVISGRAYCAHPRKGGLQGRELIDPAAHDRIQRAARAVAHLAVDKRKGD